MFMCHTIREAEYVEHHTGDTVEYWNGSTWEYDVSSMTGNSAAQMTYYHQSPRITPLLGATYQEDGNMDPSDPALPPIVMVTPSHEGMDTQPIAKWTADRIILPYPWYTQAKTNNGRWWLPYLATADIDKLTADLSGQLDINDPLTYPRF
jgi:hypothetical protein